MIEHDLTAPRACVFVAMACRCFEYSIQCCLISIFFETTSLIRDNIQIRPNPDFRILRWSNNKHVSIGDFKVLKNVEKQMFVYYFDNLHKSFEKMHVKLTQFIRILYMFGHS